MEVIAVSANPNIPAIDNTIDRNGGLVCGTDYTPNEKRFAKLCSESVHKVLKLSRER